jgi:hypothetical protein
LSFPAKVLAFDDFPLLMGGSLGELLGALAISGGASDGDGLAIARI